MKSIWRQEAALPEFPALKEERRLDTLVVGGGLAGLLTGFFLKQQGQKYAVLEKERIAGGVTGNTTGKITVHHGPVYSRLLKSLGKDRTAAYLRANQLALEQYGRMAEEISCDFSLQDNYVYSLDDKAGMLREAEALEFIGARVDYTERTNLPFHTAAAVRMKNQAQFHPLKFVSGIAEGQEIYERSFVTDIAKGRTSYQVRVRNPQGKEINLYADRVIVTSHFPFLDRWGMYFVKMYQHRSYVLALKNTGYGGGMYIGDESGSLSFRSCGELLLLGGCGGRTGTLKEGFERLRERADRVYPKAEEVASWAAQDCMTLDGAPYVGRYGRTTEGLDVAAGFNKWGMTGAMTAAMLLTGNMDRELGAAFYPQRSMLKPQLFVNGLEAARNLLSLRRHRCTHLKCGLKWNEEEQQWECPCHGSRFDRRGRVLSGPAQKTCGSLPDEGMISEENRETGRR